MQKRVWCLILTIGLMAGCATDRQRTQAEGAAVGAGVGAGLGAILGAIVGGKQGAALGAGLGGVIGAGVGLGVGTHVANKKAQYASQEDYLDALITSARHMNTQIQEYNASLTQDINRFDNETAFLVRQYNERKIRKAALQAKHKETEAKLTEARKRLEVVEKEISIQQEVLRKEKEELKSAQAEDRANTLNTEIGQLERRRDELNQQVTTLAAIGARVSV